MAPHLMRALGRLQMQISTFISKHTHTHTHTHSHTHTHKHSPHTHTHAHLGRTKVFQNYRWYFVFDLHHLKKRIRQHSKQTAKTCMVWGISSITCAPLKCSSSFTFCHQENFYAVASGIQIVGDVCFSFSLNRSKKPPRMRPRPRKWKMCSVHCGIIMNRITVSWKCL